MCIEQDHGSTVTISFADGAVASANLVIACDGIHSTVRSQFAVDKPTYSGRVAFRGLVPMSAISSDWPYSSWTLSWLAPNKHFLVFPISQNRLLNVVAFVAKEENELGGLKESWKASAPRSQLEKEYEGWTGTVQRIIKAMPMVISEWKINDREPLFQWCYMDGKVVLSGDAAHAMVPQQGEIMPSAIRLCSSFFIYELWLSSFVFLTLCRFWCRTLYRRRQRTRLSCAGLSCKSQCRLVRLYCTLPGHASSSCSKGANYVAASGRGVRHERSRLRGTEF
jgi:hypothetical protein